MEGSWTGSARLSEDVAELEDLRDDLLGRCEIIESFDERRDLLSTIGLSSSSDAWPDVYKRMMVREYEAEVSQAMLTTASGVSGYTKMSCTSSSSKPVIDASEGCTATSEAVMLG